MSDHRFSDNATPDGTDPRAYGGQWERHVRRLRLRHVLEHEALHIHLSKAPSVLGIVEVSVVTYPKNDYTLTRVESWKPATVLSVLGTDLERAFTVTTTPPASSPLADVHDADGTVLFTNVPTWSIGDLASQTPYDTTVEQKFDSPVDPQP